MLESVIQRLAEVMGSFKLFLLAPTEATDVRRIHSRPIAIAVVLIVPCMSVHASWLSDVTGVNVTSPMRLCRSDTTSRTDWRGLEPPTA